MLLFLYIDVIVIGLYKFEQPVMVGGPLILSDSGE